MFAAAAAALVDRPVPSVDVAHFLDEVATRAPLHVSWGLRGILWLGWAAPIAVGPERRTFSRLSPDARIAFWSRTLEHGVYPVRQLALVAKAMVCLCLFDERDAPSKGETEA